MNTYTPLKRIKRCIASNFIYLLGGCVITLETLLKIFVMNEYVSLTMGYLMIGEFALGLIMIVLSLQTIRQCIRQLKLNETNELLKQLVKKE